MGDGLSGGCEKWLAIPSPEPLRPMGRAHRGVLK